jgi:hypothetical protein
MWTAAITGFTSAAGAVLGAGMAGRGNLKVAKHQTAAEMEKDGRSELKGRFDRFETKVSTLDQAARNLIEALRADMWTDAVQRTYDDAVPAAMGACRTEIRPYVAGGALRDAADLVHAHVGVLIEAVNFVRANSTAAQDPDSEPSRRWIRACEQLEAARDKFASEVGAQIGYKN